MSGGAERAGSLVRLGGGLGCGEGDSILSPTADVVAARGLSALEQVWATRRGRDLSFLGAYHNLTLASTVGSHLYHMSQCSTSTRADEVQWQPAQFYQCIHHI